MTVNDSFRRITDNLLRAKVKNLWREKRPAASRYGGHPVLM